MQVRRASVNSGGTEVRESRSFRTSRLNAVRRGPDEAACRLPRVKGVDAPRPSRLCSLDSGAARTLRLAAGRTALTRERRTRMAAGNVVIVGGTQGLGRELAQSYADERPRRGRDRQGRRPRRGGRERDRRPRPAASPSTSPSHTRSRSAWRTSERSTTSCSPRSSATRTRCASTTSPARCGSSRSSSSATPR